MVSCDGSSGESSKTVAESTIPIKSAVDIESPLESGFQTADGYHERKADTKDKDRCWKRSHAWTARYYFCCGWISFPVKHEIKALFHLSWPIILTVFLQLSLNVVNVLFCGHIGKAELDTAGLAISFTNVTGLSVGMGFATACDTLLSQAYGGKNLVRVGITLQKGILILCFLLFPIYGIWLNTESIMLLLQQDPEVARLSALFVKVLMVGLPGNFFYTLLAKYLQNQGVVKPLIFVGSFTLLCSVLAHYLAIFVFDLGLLGAAGALSFSQVLQPFVCLAVIRYKRLASETWHGWSWQSLSQWGMFLQLALPGTVMMCMEWWSFEIVFFVSGAIGEADLAANVVFFQVLSALFMIPLGISIALSIRVGTYLGANEPACAKRAALVTTKLIVIWSIFVSLVLVSFRSHIGYIYTNDSEAIRLVSKTMPIVALMTVFDYIQAIVQGVFRGSGRQKTGAGVNAIGLYLIGLPIGIPLALTAGMGVFGLWVGVCVGIISLAILDVIILLRFNWHNEAKKARIRAGVSHLPTDSTDILDNETITLEVLHQRGETELADSEDSKLLLEDEEESECSSLPVRSKVDMDTENTDCETGKLHASEPPVSLPERRRLLRKRFVVLLGGTLLVVTSGIVSHYKPYQNDDHPLCGANVIYSTFTNVNNSQLILPTSSTVLSIESISTTLFTLCSIPHSSTASEEKVYNELRTRPMRPSPSPVIHTHNAD